jgi:hypothetical protein
VSASQISVSDLRFLRSAVGGGRRSGVAVAEASHLLHMRGRRSGGGWSFLPCGVREEERCGSREEQTSHSGLRLASSRAPSAS